jgi:hypothetical protein
MSVGGEAAAAAVFLHLLRLLRRAVAVAVGVAAAVGAMSVGTAAVGVAVVGNLWIKKSWLP